MWTNITRSYLREQITLFGSEQTIDNRSPQKPLTSFFPKVHKVTLLLFWANSVHLLLSTIWNKLNLKQFATCSNWTKLLWGSVFCFHHNWHPYQNGIVTSHHKVLLAVSASPVTQAFSWKGETSRARATLQGRLRISTQVTWVSGPWGVACPIRLSPPGALPSSRMSLAVAEELKRELITHLRRCRALSPTTPDRTAPASTRSMCSQQTFNKWEGMCIFVNIFSFYKSSISHHLLIWALLMLPVSLHFIFRCQLWAEQENPAGYTFRHSKQHFSRVFEDLMRADHVRSQNHSESLGYFMKGQMNADANGWVSDDRCSCEWMVHTGQEGWPSQALRGEHSSWRTFSAKRRKAAAVQEDCPDDHKAQDEHPGSLSLWISALSLVPSWIWTK